jgi:hypothetical protein
VVVLFVVTPFHFESNHVALLAAPIYHRVFIATIFAWVALFDDRFQSAASETIIPFIIDLC